MKHDDGFMLVGGRKYPKIILGGDRFLDYWGKQQDPKLARVDGVLTLMESAYNAGIKGFDISLNTHVIEAFNLLRSRHPDVIGIGNPNWYCGLNLNRTAIFDLASRFRTTIVRNVFDDSQRSQVEAMPKERRQRWFGAASDTQPLSRQEIDAIYLDESTFHANLAMLKGAVEFVVIGTDFADWLIPLGREDLIQRMCSIARDYGFASLSISHWISLTLPILEQMQFDGHWIYLNKLEQLVSPRTTFEVLKQTRKPLTAFRVLAGGALAHNQDDAIRFIKESGARSVVLGADKAEHLQTTVPIIKRVMSD